jgi:hypothetical protein
MWVFDQSHHVPGWVKESGYFDTVTYITDRTVFGNTERKNVLPCVFYIHYAPIRDGAALGEGSVRIKTEFVSTYVEPNVEGLIEIRPEAEPLGIPVFERVEVRGGINDRAETEEFWGHGFRGIVISATVSRSSKTAIQAGSLARFHPQIRSREPGKAGW